LDAKVDLLHNPDLHFLDRSETLKKPGDALGLTGQNDAFTDRTGLDILKINPDLQPLTQEEDHGCENRKEDQDRAARHLQAKEDDSSSNEDKKPNSRRGDLVQGFPARPRVRVIVKALQLEEKRAEWNDEGKNPKKGWEGIDINQTIEDDHVVESQKMGDPEGEPQQHSVGNLEQLLIDFVSVRDHEILMQIKTSEERKVSRDTGKTLKNNSGIVVFKPASVVGIVDSLEAWRAASRLGPGTVDFLEWRADCLGGGIPLSKIPWIVTARHPAEGGCNARSASVRRALLESLLPFAAIVDIEARSLAALRGVLSEAKSRGVRVLVSFHDFKKTPTVGRLRDVIGEAVDVGADAVKIATVTSSSCDVARLLELFRACPLPLAAMGMGPLGMASRVLFAGCGSVLNYGWLHRPNVVGQWSARELRGLLDKCTMQDRR
jgi:3-dehydroquinate dehydratase-1